MSDPRPLMDELIEALRPFADAAKIIEERRPDGSYRIHDAILFEVSAGNLRRAAAALARAEAEGASRAADPSASPSPRLP